MIKDALNSIEDVPSKIGWAYPDAEMTEQMKEKYSGNIPTDSKDRFLKTGGFVVLNRKNAILKIFEIMPLEAGESSDAQMYFESPFVVSEKDWNKHCKHSSSITLPSLLVAGVEEY